MPGRQQADLLILKLTSQMQCRVLASGLCEHGPTSQVREHRCMLLRGSLFAVLVNAPARSQVAEHIVHCAEHVVPVIREHRVPAC